MMLAPPMAAAALLRPAAAALLCPAAATSGVLLRPTAAASRPRRLRPPASLRVFSYSSDTRAEAYRVPEPRRNFVADWVSENDGLARSLPILVGGVSLVAVLLNRGFSGVAPVADASSSQSRADLLTLALAVTNILAGLVWLSIQPKNVFPVVPRGVECRRISCGTPHSAVLELLWAWEALSSATCSKSFIVVYGDDCLLQIGVAAESSAENGDAVVVDVPKLIQGLLYRNVLESGKQSYLANLSLYPGRSELPFLPTNTQAVILQPLGDRGIAIIGGDTIRGFSNLDQAWITLVAEKLDATLSKSSGTSGQDSSDSASTTFLVPNLDPPLPVVGLLPHKGLSSSM